MNIPSNLRYTEEHEWLRVEGTRGKVGITEFAQDQLGDIVFVELPEVGRVLKRGEVFGVVESVKSVSDLFAPVGGKVVAVNSALGDRPEAVNADPYGEAWMVEIEMQDEAEAGALMDPQAYAGHVQQGGH